MSIIVYILICPYDSDSNQYSEPVFRPGLEEPGWGVRGGVGGPRPLVFLAALNNNT